MEQETWSTNSVVRSPTLASAGWCCYGGRSARSIPFYRHTGELMDDWRAKLAGLRFMNTIGLRKAPVLAMEISGDALCHWTWPKYWVVTPDFISFCAHTRCFVFVVIPLGWANVTTIKTPRELFCTRQGVEMKATKQVNKWVLSFFSTGCSARIDFGA